MGDPAGISAEIAAKLLADRAIHDKASLLVIGDRRTLAEGERIAGVETNIKVVSEPRAPLKPASRCSTIYATAIQKACRSAARRRPAVPA